jgi:hypothetical protein
VLRVTESCTDIPLGAFLKRFEPIPIPLCATFSFRRRL